MANYNNATDCLIALWLALHLQHIAELGYTIFGVAPLWHDNIETCAKARACSRFGPKQRKRNFHFYSSVNGRAACAPKMYAFIAVFAALRPYSSGASMLGFIAVSTVGYAKKLQHSVLAPLFSSVKLV